MPPHPPDLDALEPAAALEVLAQAHEVLTAGPGAATVPTETVRRVLDALGVPASTDGEVRESLAARRRHWRPLEPTVTAHRQGCPRGGPRAARQEGGGVRAHRDGAGPTVPS